MSEREERLAAIRALLNAVRRWNEGGSPTETGEEDPVLESVERGSAVHAAVVAAEGAFGGEPARMPPPLNDTWAAFFHAVGAALGHAEKSPPATEAYSPELSALVSAAWAAKQAFQRAVEAELGEAAVLTLGDASQDVKTCPVQADVKAGTITVDGKEYPAEPHHCRMIQELVDARGVYRTGGALTGLPACHGKKVSREFAILETAIPELKKYLLHGGNQGYRLVWKPCP